MIDFQVMTSKEATVSVTYFDPLEPEFVVSKPTEMGFTHDFTIVRLKAETEYHYKVIAADKDGHKSPPKNGKFVTGALPPAVASPVTRIELVRGTGTTHPTLIDFNHQDPPVVGRSSHNSTATSSWTPRAGSSGITSIPSDPGRDTP